MSLDIMLLNDGIVCPNCGHEIPDTGGEVYSQNITHNLTRMASEAGVYEILWHPETAEIERAEQLIAPLEAAIAAMKADPARFEKHNAPNGWGLYKHFVPWLERLLAACRQFPSARVHASR